MLRSSLSRRISMMAACGALAACQSTSEANERELQTRLAGQSVVFLGCARRCPPNRTCGSDALDRVRADLGARPLVIETREGGFEDDHRYYFVDERGAGTLYRNVVSESYQYDDRGWTREQFQTLELSVNETTTTGSFERSSFHVFSVTLSADGRPLPSVRVNCE